MSFSITDDILSASHSEIARPYTDVSEISHHVLSLSEAVDLNAISSKISISVSSQVHPPTQQVKLTQPNQYQELSSTHSDVAQDIEIRPLKTIQLDFQTELLVRKQVQTQMNDELIARQVKHRSRGELGKKLEEALLGCKTGAEQTVTNVTFLKGFLELSTERGVVVTKQEAAVGDAIRPRGTVELGAGRVYAASVK